jgi:hypothetical protein
MNAAQEKPVPQVALEVMMKRNKEAADKLLAEAKKLLAENRMIETEMAKVLPSVPPASQSVSLAPQSSIRPDPMGGLLHAADALVRSWKRRNKKNFKQLELDLMTALERMNG